MFMVRNGEKVLPVRQEIRECPVNKIQRSNATSYTSIQVQVLQYRLFVSLLILTVSPLGPGGPWGPWKSKTNKSADLKGRVAKLFCVQALHAS